MSRGCSAADARSKCHARSATALRRYSVDIPRVKAERLINSVAFLTVVFQRNSQRSLVDLLAGLCNRGRPERVYAHSTA